MRIQSIIAVILFSIALVACSKDESSSDQGGYSLRIGDSLNKKSSSIQVQSAIAFLEEVELEKEVGNDDDELEIDIEGRFRVDLLTGLSSPEIPTAQIEPGNYHELELEFGDEDRQAFEISGTYTDTSGQIFNFTLSTIAELEFEIEAEGNGLVIPADYFVTLNVNFPVASALNNLDWNSANVGTGNTILINQQSNSALLAAFLQNLNLQVDD